MIATTRRGRLVLAATLSLLLAGASMTLGPAAAAPTPHPSAEALSARVVLPSGPKAPAPAGLDARLAALAAASADAPRMRSLAKAGGVTLSGDRVTVVVQARPGETSSAEKAVRAAGAGVDAASDGSLLARVPVSRLAALAGAPGVLRVRTPLRPRKLAVTGTEGVRITGADAVQASGTVGDGVRVGIIDVGFADYQQLEAEGYLPDASMVETNVFDAEHLGVTFEGDPHGSAVAEIVHEMAPGARLYLAAVGSEFDLASAVEWMNDNDVKIVSMSLGWIGSPLDGGSTPGADNVVNAAVGTAVNTNGMFWSNASGNFRLNHWKGDFNDRDGDFGLNWDGRSANLNAFYYDPSTGPLEGILWWHDSWTNAINDYDLVLFKYNESLRQFQSIGFSPSMGEASQWGRTGDQPYEEIYYPDPAEGWYAWAVVNMRPWPENATASHRWLPANRGPVDFDFFCPNQEIDIVRTQRSIMTPADNESGGFMAVGAISARWAQRPYTKYFAIGDPGFGQEELYSSEGPNQDGALTPEITAPDNVTNHVFATTYGSTATFRGTSASAPHLAGAAALALERLGASTTASQLETYLRSKALGLATPGPDTMTGFGALRLPPPATPAMEATRLAGTDRYRTSLAVSRTWASGSATSVVVASGATFPDALAGASLAGAFGSPMVLTPRDSMTPDIIAELHRLGATSVHVLGSTAAVSSTVAQQLSAEGFAVVRHAGATRYETAASVAAASLDLRPADTAFVVNGDAFPDALAAAPLSYGKGFPVLPVGKDAIPRSIASVLRNRGIKHVYLVGSSNVVSSQVAFAIEAMGITVGRAGGAGRYDTAKAVIDLASSRGWSTFAHLGIASGTNFPDALAGAAEAGRGSGVVLLTPPGILGPQAESVLRARAAGAASVHLYGGEPALQGAVLLGAKDIADR